ncbi:MAG: AbrB/MazE/SpoVT family DNA-binding domain-containing protein [Candidatus Thermoplasmatota archaeon]|nr:AbrB/MazE/SpoVT family DNA-binding domain-containing protein [Candidatus Thermoplasmatota archaeon]
MHLRRRVIRVGNSLAIRLQRGEARRLQVREGDEVSVTIEKPAQGLRIDAAMLFHDGRGSVDHDDEVADAAALRG